jgi:hypothetical protein
MANIITAGNSSNGGTAISTDTSGTLNIVTGSGSGANAITIDASQNVTFANAISVAGSTTITGALAVTGTVTASGGVSGGIRSATAVASTSGTSIDFTSLPTGLKRITVMFSGVSHNGSTAFNDQFIIQLGAGSVTTSGYVSICVTTAATTGFLLTNSVSGAVTFSGVWTIALIGSNKWSQSGNISGNGSCQYSAGTVTLGGELDRVRVTTVGGTDTFDAGTINILYE